MSTLHPRIKRLRWQVGGVIALLLSLPFALVPRSIAFSLGSFMGKLAFRLLPRTRRTTMRNIENSLFYLRQQPGWQEQGSAEEIARQTFANLGRTFMEVLKLYYGLGKTLLHGVEISGLEHYKSAHAKGKGIIFITGHCGNWELMALSFGLRYGGVSVVARRQEDTRFNAFLEKLRLNYGNRVIYADGAARRILFHLRQEGNIGILMDKAMLPTEGIQADFLGRAAWTTPMPAILAEKTGAPLHTIFMHRTATGHMIEISPEIPLIRNADGSCDQQAVTAHLNELISQEIARHPTEWLWMYRRWKRAAEA
jgi:KDO2-lipid IV(A) lauroyltransferase